MDGLTFVGLALVWSVRSELWHSFLSFALFIRILGTRLLEGKYEVVGSLTSEYFFEKI